MRYMLLVYSAETAQPSPEMGEVAAQAWTVMQDMAAHGVFRGAEPLQPTATAKTVRSRGGKPIILDGPFAETKEQLAGYYIVDCGSLEEALAWAQRIPTACKGGAGCIEVRSLEPIAQPGTPEFKAAGEALKK